MAVLDLTALVKQMPAKYPVLQPTANLWDLVFTPAGAACADGAEFPLTGKEIVIVHNGAVAAKTLTVTSYADEFNRTGDVTAYSLGASEYMMLPQFQPQGWANPSGNLHMVASDTAVEFLVLRLSD
jgi:hypothetical protein